MKDTLTENPKQWEVMLANVPQRPLAGRPAGNWQLLKPSPADEMRGMFSKYNGQYRMASPISQAMIDVWNKSQAILDPEDLKVFQGGDFDIDKTELKHTPIWGDECVDWSSWCRKSPSSAAAGPESGSSMLVPVFKDHSAVAEYYFRSVTAVCFPAFCYLMGKLFTAAEIQEAWVLLPIVKLGKKKRGTHAGTNRRAFAQW